MISIRPLLLMLASLVLCHCANPSSSNTAIASLMIERLHWMDEVARVKQSRGLPVADSKREAELLDAMARQGAQAGIPAQATRGFFRGQIEAAKLFQEAWLRDHANASPSPSPLPDLTKTVRPALDDIGRRMIAVLAHDRRIKPKASVIADARDQLTRAGFTREVVKAAICGLEEGLR